MNDIVIVSGLPRSGTSMMMKMLASGGLDVVTDNERKADIDNPKGYFEFEAVKKIKQDSSWLQGMKGRAFKMVATLLMDLPEGSRYKVIFMRRAMPEMLASQRKMLQRLGKEDSVDDAQMEAYFTRHLQKVDSWLSGRKDIDVLNVDYSDIIDDPLGMAGRVSEFLGGGLDVGAMSGAVDSSLYRNRV